jgi:hypothetical protein
MDCLGKPTATAKGMAVVDLCAYEDCHTGAYSSVPIKLIASKVATCTNNKRAYAALRYVFVDGSPWPGMPADMNTSNYIAAPNRTLPPQNQTVELTTVCPVCPVGRVRLNQYAEADGARSEAATFGRFAGWRHQAGAAFARAVEQRGGHKMILPGLAPGTSLKGY